MSDDVLPAESLTTFTAAECSKLGTAQITLPERTGLIRQTPAFGSLQEAAADALAAELTEEAFDAGALIVAEGDIGDKLFIIARGRAEVTAATPLGPAILATLGSGELFGEIALLSSARLRQATVKAISPLLTLALSQSDFNALLRSYPSVQHGLETAAEQMLLAKFLKLASPFRKLDARQLRSLAAHLEEVSIPAGAMIVQQGAPGDKCYLVRTGRVRVWCATQGGEERQLATLGPGSLFGEASLLTDAPRNATVQAIDPCQLLALDRGDLLEAMSDRQVGAQLVELMHLRSERPMRADGVTAHQQTTPDGETITVLKDAHRGAYYRLSAPGQFLWERLDGQHTLQDLTLDYFEIYKAFAPGTVAEVLGGLAAAGFLKTPTLQPDVVERLVHVTPWQRTMVEAKRLMQARLSLPYVDAALARLYRGGGWLLFTRPAQCVLTFLALSGVAAFAAGIAHAAKTVSGHGAGAAFLLLFIPIYLLSIVIHEAGHALTVKHFGHEVPRAGIGWYWFSPVAYVDTSDMWLADRWPRIAVSLAGPYASLLVGALASLVIPLVNNSMAIEVLWQLAMASYGAVILNLNPLMEYDGYFVLIDWLDRPNLRSQSLAWLGQLPRMWRAGGTLSGHRLDLLYGLCSMAFLGLAGVLTVALYRLVLQDWIARLLPAFAAASLAWFLAVAVVGLCVAATAGDLRGRGRQWAAQ